MHYNLKKFDTLYYFNTKATPKKLKKHRHRGSSSDMESIDESDTESQTSGMKHKKTVIIPSPRRPSLLPAPGRYHYGSFYLRMGAVGK